MCIRDRIAYACPTTASLCNSFGNDEGNPRVKAKTALSRANSIHLCCSNEPPSAELATPCLAPQHRPRPTAELLHIRTSQIVRATSATIVALVRHDMIAAQVPGAASQGRLLLPHWKIYSSEPPHAVVKLSIGCGRVVFRATTAASDMGCV